MTRFVSHFFLLTSFLLPFFSYAQIDLEEYAQDFVLETKQILIESAPDAFNPSIVKWKDAYWMSFRCIENPDKDSPFSSAAVSCIEMIELGENFLPIGQPYSLILDHPDLERPVMLAEDGRLMTVGDHLYLIYSGNKHEEITDEGFRMYVAELEYDGKDFHVLSNECLTQFEGVNPSRREKNWVPFEYEEHLLLAYTLFPHKILHPLLDESGVCVTRASTYPSIVWEWGEIRGGTPAFRLNEQFYLGFFHSSTVLSTVHSKHQPVPHYFMGAYVFSASPPFEIQYVSPEPIIGKNFYHGPVYEPYWHPVHAIFPCGMIVEENEIWISYGRQDHEMWIVKLDKEKLLESFINVSTLVLCQDKILELGSLQSPGV